MLRHWNPTESELHFCHLLILRLCPLSVKWGVAKIKQIKRAKVLGGVHDTQEEFVKCSLLIYY